MTNLLTAAIAHGRVWAMVPGIAEALVAELQVADALAHRQQFEEEGPTPFATIAAYGRSSGGEASDKPYQIVNGIALIAVLGVMTKAPMSYRGTSTKLTQQAVRHAARDEDVKGILMLWDTPGGSVEGLQELFDEIATANTKKPVTSFWEDNCYSAGCFCAVAAGKVAINAGGYCGSLSTLMVLRDTSKQAEAEGVEVIVFKTGPLKGQGTPGTALSDEGRAMYQREVDHFGVMFREALKMGRKLTDKAVDAIFTGDSFSPTQALKLGLVDSIGTLDDAFADLVAQTEADAADAPDPDDDGSDPASRALALVATTPLPAAPSVPPTISAPGGQPGSAGTTRLPLTGAGNNRNMLKPLIVRALTRLGYGIAATNIANSPDEDAEGVAGALVAQIDTEVKAKVDAHPLMMACHAQGINSVDDLKAAMELRAVGQRALTDIRTEAKAVCVMAKGADLAPVIAGQVDSQPYEVVKANLAAWQAEADSKFGTGPDGRKPARQTVASGNTAIDVEDAQPEPKTAWARLNDAQHKLAKSLGHDTEAKREAYAMNLLGEVV